MIKILSFMVTFAFAFSCFAKEPLDLPLRSVPKALMSQIEYDESAANVLKSRGYEDSDEIHPSWIHHLKKVKDGGYHIALEDGSEWETSWWDHFKVKNWDVDDLIVIHLEYDSLKYKIKNITKNEKVSGSLFKIASSDSPNLLWIESIHDNYSTVVLSDGSILHSSFVNIFINWKEGQSLITVLVKKDKEFSYALLDMSSFWLIYDLEFRN